jgi:hypothetical protein
VHAAGPAGGPPEILYGSVVDYYAAALVAGGVSSALYEREKSGEGQYVGVSLLRSALAMQSARMVWAESEPREVGRDMRSGGITGIHPTREGYLYISANTPHFWQALCEKTGLPSCWSNATTACASARSTSRRSCRACTRRWRRAARWNGKRCSARKCLAPRRARWRTCSTSRRWPKAWSVPSPRTWSPSSSTRWSALPRLHPRLGVRPHAGANPSGPAPIVNVYTDNYGRRFEVDAAGRQYPIGQFGSYRDQWGRTVYLGANNQPAYIEQNGQLTPYGGVAGNYATAPLYDRDGDGVADQYDRAPNDPRYR